MLFRSLFCPFDIEGCFCHQATYGTFDGHAKHGVGCLRPGLTIAGFVSCVPVPEAERRILNDLFTSFCLMCSPDGQS